MNRRVVLVLLALVLIGGGAAVYLWHTGWFSASPRSVLMDTFAKANKGDYEGANSNIQSNDGFRREPGLPGSVWDDITKKKTITGIRILKEHITQDKAGAKVEFEILYQDGDSVPLVAYFDKENGVWKHSIASTARTLSPDSAPDSLKQAREQLIKETPPVLSPTFTNVEGTGLGLRLPVGCQEVFDEYHHPKLGLRFQIDSDPGFSFEDRVRQAEAKLSVGYLLKSEKITIDGAKAQFFDASVNNKIYKDWRFMIVVLGTEKRSIMIIAQCPDDKRITKVAKECLFNVRWDPLADPDLSDRLPFSVNPAKDLHLRQVKLYARSILFTESGKEKPPTPGEGTATISFHSPAIELKDRRAYFETTLRIHLPDGSKQQIEKILPLKVGPLEGFEVASTVYSDQEKIEQFRYSAVLFSNGSDHCWLEGVVQIAQRERFEQQFRQMARSIELK
jgi:hypothetical protein